ncbi:MAG: putative lipid II flippase FtsW, partial [Verrucomicrobiota bacterium]|nr:putative lipid II flippase FtsW [Verrucomicrobiota bacterium]
HHGDPNYIIKRQCLWLALGVVVCLFAASLDYHFWQRTCWLWYLGAAVFLMLCFVPGIGKRINGSARWINFGIGQFQPSEIAKLAVVACLAWWYSRESTNARSFWQGFVAPLFIAGGLMALIAPEVDIGTTALIGMAAFALMFVAGARTIYVVPICIIGLAGMIYVATQIGERADRLLAFLDLEKYREGAGLQQWQALIAFGSGGIEGLGLGSGRQKMAYLPYAHTDFIFPMIGEELGLRITLLIIFCYLLLILCGVAIAMQSRDRFGALLGVGVVLLIALQAAVNIGVTTALLPNKGLPLPFISYGGSNLVFCLLCIGILINIYRQGLTDGDARRAQVRLMARTKPQLVRL